MTFSQSFAILDELLCIQDSRWLPSTVAHISIPSLILSAAWSVIRLWQLVEQASITRRTTRSNVFRPRFAPKKCLMFCNQPGTCCALSSPLGTLWEDAIRAKVARQRRLPIWSSRLRSVFVNSSCRLDMTSDGMSFKILGEPFKPEMSVCRAARVG